jgi:hypothetical protein
VAEWIIADVVAGNPPLNVQTAIDRYAQQLGAPHPFNTGPKWSGDLREAAIWTLIRNGFAKGKTVRVAKDGTLSNWQGTELELAVAAAVESEFGGSRALSLLATEIVKDTRSPFGARPEADYVYTDSRLDSLGGTCAKIGRHNSFGTGAILRCILQQYKTGNPGYPRLHLIAMTDDASGLEGRLHRRFAKQNIKGGFGTEWFKVSIDDIATAIKDEIAKAAAQ